MTMILLAALLVVSGAVGARAETRTWYTANADSSCEPALVDMDLPGQLHFRWRQRDTFPEAVGFRDDGLAIVVVAATMEQCEELRRDVFDGGF